jgi:hypothetical protein
VTGIVRGKTLVEKAYGPGFRDTPHMQAVAPWPGCGVEGCTDPVYGSRELYVDDPPPVFDWYTKLLARLPLRVWTDVKFCQGHMADVTVRSVEEPWDNPDLWAPWRASPPVLTHPPKLITPKGA